MSRIRVTVTVPDGAQMPALFFSAEDRNSVTVSDENFAERTTWETDGGLSASWTEGRQHTPSMLVGIAEFSTTGVANAAGGLDYVFEVIQTVHWDVPNTNLLFRAFSVVPATARDMSVNVGMEIVNTEEEICFTTRPSMDWFLPKILYIQGVSAINIDPYLADTYSMAPIGADVSFTDEIEWVSYYCGTFGAKTSPSTVYRSHQGGGSNMFEVSFYDQYYFVSSGMFTSGVTPGCVVGGGVVAGAMPITVSRALGKTHSEDWGVLGTVLGVIAAVAVIYSGGSALAGLAVGTIAKTAISSLSFYEGIPQNTTIAEIYNNDQVMWIRS
jgi:hypothetical protein